MGRKAKPKLSLQEQEDEVILKYLNGEPMTLDEAALALWMCDGRKTKKPMTRMGYLKFEKRVLDKLHDACEKMNIGPEILQSFGNCRHTCATGNYGNSIDEY